MQHSWTAFCTNYQIICISTVLSFHVINFSKLTINWLYVPTQHSSQYCIFPAAASLPHLPYRNIGIVIKWLTNRVDFRNTPIGVVRKTFDELFSVSELTSCSFFVDSVSTPAYTQQGHTHKTQDAGQIHVLFANSNKI